MEQQRLDIQVFGQERLDIQVFADRLENAM